MESTTPGSLSLRIGKLEPVTANPYPQASTQVQFTTGSAAAGRDKDSHYMLVPGGVANGPEQFFDHATLKGRMETAKRSAPEDTDHLISIVRHPNLDGLIPAQGKQVFQQIFVFAQIGRGFQQSAADTPIILGLQQRQQFMPDPVA
jgi:hypothetical protein